MSFLKKAYCHVFQIGFRAVLPVLPYREPEIIRSCADLSPVLEKEHVRTVLIVTDRGIVENGLNRTARRSAARRTRKLRRVRQNPAQPHR